MQKSLAQTGPPIVMEVPHIVIAFLKVSTHTPIVMAVLLCVDLPSLAASLTQLQSRLTTTFKHPRKSFEADSKQTPSDWKATPKQTHGRAQSTQQPPESGLPAPWKQPQSSLTPTRSETEHWLNSQKRHSMRSRIAIDV